MMTEVHTVSIVAKNKYSAKAGGLPHPARGGTKVRKPFTRAITPPAIIFASRFALNGSSRHARIMAMGISIKTAEPIRSSDRQETKVPIGKVPKEQNPEGRRLKDPRSSLEIGHLSGN